MQHYVCGFLADASKRVVLLRKNTPAWQAGKLNGVGGKVEPGESLRAAMVREWAEEYGVSSQYDWHYFATQIGPRYQVHFYRARTERLPNLPETNDVGEGFEVWPADQIGELETISNLPWLVPLAFSETFPLFVTAREVRCV